MPNIVCINAVYVEALHCTYFVGLGKSLELYNNSVEEHTHKV